MTHESEVQGPGASIQFGGDLYPSLARALRAAWMEFRVENDERLEAGLPAEDSAIWEEFIQNVEGEVFVDGVRLFQANLQELCDFKEGDEGYGLALGALARRALEDPPVFVFRGQEVESLELALLMAFGEWNGGQIVEAAALEASPAFEELRYWLQEVIQVDGQKLTDWNAGGLIGLQDPLADALLMTLRSIDFSSAD